MDLTSYESVQMANDSIRLCPADGTPMEPIPVRDAAIIVAQADHLAEFSNT
jgi:hypothetical protein